MKLKSLRNSPATSHRPITVTSTIRRALSLPDPALAVLGGAVQFLLTLFLCWCCCFT
jgi:hypothetical protein